MVLLFGTGHEDQCGRHAGRVAVTTKHCLHVFLDGSIAQGFATLTRAFWKALSASSMMA